MRAYLALAPISLLAFLPSISATATPLLPQAFARALIPDRLSVDPTVTNATTTLVFDSAAPVGKVTPDQIIALAPGSISCQGAHFGAEECRTAEQAAPLINAAFEKYGVKTVGQAAAILGLMAFESGPDSFQANINHFPGRPGQGTKAMLNFNFIFPFVTSFPELASKAAAIDPTLTNATAGDDTPAEVQSAIRELVLGDDYTFQAGVWFVATSGGKCPTDTFARLASDGESGWVNYITNCVFTGVAERRAGWVAAVKAFSSDARELPIEDAAAQRLRRQIKQDRRRSTRAGINGMKKSKSRRDRFGKLGGHRALYREP